MKQEKSDQELSITMGKNLRKFRLAKDLSQKDVADFLKVSQMTISRYENGKALGMRAGKLFSLCKLYEIKASDIVG